MKHIKRLFLFIAVLCVGSLFVLASCASEEEADGYRQLTTEELSLDTRSLAELVLQSPYLTYPPADVLAQEDGTFEWACDSFNGLQELMKREDAGNVLAQIYNDAVAKLAQAYDSDAYHAALNSEFLLSYPVFDEKRTVELTDFNWASIIMHHVTDETPEG